MGLSRIVAFFSTVASNISNLFSTGLLVSSGTIPLEGSSIVSDLEDAGGKSYLPLSYSLQDFTLYNKSHREEDAYPIVSNKNSTNSREVCSLQREFEIPIFSKEKSCISIFRYKKWLRAIICISFFLICFASFHKYSRYFSTREELQHFHVMMDCGSTGTRVFVYEWFLDHKQTHRSFPVILRSLPKRPHRKSRTGRVYHRMETEPAFDKLVHNTSGLRAALRPLLHWAEKQIPKHAHGRTPIFLYATAGVRRLPNADSKWLLDEAWTILKNSSFICQRNWVKVISGTEEAYYGWIALNHHMGMLGSSVSSPTYGALDLGGSSLQITFETKKLMHETSLNLSIGSTNHYLSAYSLSGYGLNDAFDKSVTHLVKRLSERKPRILKHGKVKIKHPCLHTGYRRKYACSHCSSLDVAWGRDTDPYRKPMTVELLGAPQWETCSELAKMTVNLSEWSHLDPGIDCKVQPCALHENLPRPHGKFFAISGFFVVYRFFNLTSDATLNQVLEKGQDFCEKTWEKAKSSVIPQPFIEQYCFRAPYIVSLLRDGLHIKDDQVIIGSGSITWTLGVVLAEAGRALSQRKNLFNYQILYTRMSSTVIFVFFIFLLSFLICVISYGEKSIYKFFHRMHLPFFRSSSPTASLQSKSSFGFQRWSPVYTGDGRVKTPHSPTVSVSEPHPFGLATNFGGSFWNIGSSFHPSKGAVSHSYSSGNLGGMLFNKGAGSFFFPRRNRLQSRRSQSKEDLNTLLTEVPMAKA